MALYSGVIEQEDQDAIVGEARAGDLESLQQIFAELIDKKMMVTCSESTSRATCLHAAAGNGHLEMVKYILDIAKETYSNDSLKLKNFVDNVNETGNTALHWASLNGHLPIVRLLCEEYEADPFIRNSFGHDAIFEAEKNGKEEVENFFLTKYDVEPEDEEEEGDSAQSATTENVQISEGTEIEQVTAEATEALRQQTENLEISK